MIPLIIALGAFVCVFAGALVGLWLGRNVPEHYRDSPSQEAIQLATGMLSVLAALVLGLLTSSIQSNFDTINTEVNDFAAQLAMLDQTLVDMGPEAASARQILRRYTELSIQENWPEESGAAQHGSRSEIVQSFASIFESLRGVAHPMWREGPDTNRLLNSLRLAVAGLPAEGEPAQTLRASAVDLSQTLVEARWTLHERTQNPLLPSFLVILTFWTTAIFLSFGYNAPCNPAVIVAFFIAAVALAASFDLLIEMDIPFEGLLRISSHAMHDALEHMTQ